MRVINTTDEDLVQIWDLFDKALEYQKENNFHTWVGYDRDVVLNDIANGLQYKVVDEGEMVGIFSATYEDILLWGSEGAMNDSVYVHRIIRNRAYVGEYKLVDCMMTFLQEHARRKDLAYIRLDTWHDNDRIVSYYMRYGFVAKRIVKPDATGLPLQYQGLTQILLECSV